jgi:hypothetical protein
VPGPGGVTSSGPVQIDTDGDGVPDTTVPATSNFAPGWSPFPKPGCSVPPCRGSAPHQAPSHSHWVIPPPSSGCTATAHCWDGSTVTCTGSAGSCSAVDSACPSSRGSVTCNGITTLCPTACPAVCTEGATRYVWDGSSCCDPGVRFKEQQICSQGQWEYTGSFVCSAGPCSP